MIHFRLIRLLVLTLTIFSMAFPAFAQKKKRVDPLAMPEITRDQVICFALYTVHDKTLKLDGSTLSPQGRRTAQSNP